MNLKNWHDFQTQVLKTGFRIVNLISSTSFLAADHKHMLLLYANGNGTELELVSVYGCVIKQDIPRLNDILSVAGGGLLGETYQNRHFFVLTDSAVRPDGIFKALKTIQNEVTTINWLGEQPSGVPHWSATLKRLPPSVHHFIY